MTTIKVNNIEYKIEFGFDAAETEEFIQKLFRFMTGSYLAENSEDMDNLTAKDVIFGTTNMFSELPKLCALGFYAGLIQNHGFSKEESNSIMRLYMKENDLSYNDSFAFLKECMEKDGFFKLIGLDKVMEGMTEKEVQPEAEVKKVPQDHKKKQTGTK